AIAPNPWAAATRTEVSGRTRDERTPPPPSAAPVAGRRCRPVRRERRAPAGRTFVARAACAAPRPGGSATRAWGGLGTRNRPRRQREEHQPAGVAIEPMNGTDLGDRNVSCW